MKNLLFVLAQSLTISLSLCDDNNSWGFDPNAEPNMWLGENLSAGVLDVDANTGKKAYYAMVTCREGSDQNTPQVIGNAGGPGMTSMWYLFKGMGPYKVNQADGVVSRESDYSVTNFADYLLPEFPLGTGWSTTGEWLTSTEDNDTDFLLFMNALSLVNPLVNKTRAIYFHGNGYAGTLLTNMALKLALDGWNVRGMMMSGAWVDTQSYVGRIATKLNDDGSKGFTYPYWDWWGKMTKLLVAGNIVGSRWSSAYMALGTTSGFPWTRNLTKAASDSRDSTWDDWRDMTEFFQDFLQSETLRTQMNGGDSEMHMWNKDVARSMFYNTAQKTFSVTVENLLDIGVKIMFMEGEYGHPTDIYSQLDWFNRTSYARQGFVDKVWQWTTFGAIKGWGNVCWEKVTDSGSFVEFDRQVAAYTRLQNLAVHDSICD